MSQQSKTLTTAADDVDDESIEENDLEEQEELDRQDYGEYRQQPIQLRRSRPIPADVAPRPTTHRPTRTSPTRPQTRTTDTRTTDTPAQPRQSQRQQMTHWLQRNLFHVGIGMFVALFLWWVGVSYIVPFATSVSTHWTYGGDVPITQVDANVGHHGMSHFLAEYWHGEVLVVEFPGQDATHAHTYAFPLTTAHDTTSRIVTLHITSVNLHGQPGKPDVIIQVAGYSVAPVLYNTGDAFTTSQPN